MYEQIRKSFLNDGIFLKESWLHSLFDSGQKTREQIFTKLINTDISETCEPCPLPDLSNSETIKYEGGQVFLQINEVIDISLPYEKRVALERSYKGTLKIFLTDGVTNYFAITKTPLTSFHTGATPGSKIFLKPPIEGKFGIIFLNENKIKFCNGCSQQVIEARNKMYSKSYQPTKKNSIPKPQNKPINQTIQQPQNPDIRHQGSNHSQYLSDSNDEDEMINHNQPTKAVNNDMGFSQAPQEVEISDIESDFEVVPIAKNLINRSNDQLYRSSRTNQNEFSAERSDENSEKDDQKHYLFLSDEDSSDSSVTIEENPHKQTLHKLKKAVFSDEDSDGFDVSESLNDDDD